MGSKSTSGQFELVGKTAALWSLVVVAIGMTGKIHNVTNNTDYIFSYPQGKL